MNEIRLLSVAERELLALKGVEECDSLPVLPIVISTLLAIDEDNPYSLDYALSIAKADPCFAARVISLAYRHRDYEMTDALALGPAIRALGKEGLATPLLDHSKALVFAPSKDAQKHLWMHAIQVAMLSEQLSYLVSWEVDGELAYFAGLLHDLGRFVSYFKESDLPIYLEAYGLAMPEDLTDAEAANAVVSHTLVGPTASETWGLPTVFRDVMARHHIIAHIEEVQDTTSILIGIVRLADAISYQLLSGHEPETPEFHAMLEEHMKFDSIVHGDLVSTAERIARMSRQCADEAFVNFHKLEIGETNYTKHKSSL